VRRARCRSASTDETVVSRASATSAVERPDHSRSTSASRCAWGRPATAARTSRTVRCASAWRSTPALASSGSHSSASGMDGSRRAATRARHSLRAMRKSHARGSRTLVPLESAAYAFANVACVASSASSRRPSVCSV
jgi:hypothetical protein